MWLPLKSVTERRGKKCSYGVWKAACVRLGLKNTLAYSPAVQAGRREHCLTCSFVSRCRSGSGRTARKPGVRPSLSAPPAGHTASGWSAGKRTRSPTSARQSESRSPASKRGNEGNKQKQEYSGKHKNRQILHQKMSLLCLISCSFIMWWRGRQLSLFMHWFVAVFSKSDTEAEHCVRILKMTVYWEISLLRNSHIFILPDFGRKHCGQTL